MPHNPDFTIAGDLQPVVRVEVALKDPNQHGTFAVTITGPEDIVQSFFRPFPLVLTLFPPDALEYVLEKYLHEQYSEPKDADPAGEEPPLSLRRLDIVVQVAQTDLSDYVLLLQLDYDLSAGEERLFYVDDLARAWAVSDPTNGNPNLYLSEKNRRGVWKQRQSSTHPNTLEDRVDRSKVYNGDWRLRVRAVDDCTFDLTGVFTSS